MKILVYGINYSPELTGIGKYSGEMARWLATQGHEVKVITAPPYYPEWKIKEGFHRYGFSKSVEDAVTVIRCPLYVPVRLTALKRLLHLASFSLTSTFAIVKQWRWKPKLIILVVPTLFCAPQALLLAKATGARTVLHVQDYEVDALFGLGLAKNEFLKNCAFAIERKILQMFDKISTISPSMLKRARQKGVKEEKLLFFPNWSETARFRNVSRSPSLLQRLGVDPTKKILLYSGNIGEKQGLESLIEAAKRLEDYKEVVFLVVGEGAGKARLVELSRKYSLTNIVFAPLQPYEDLPMLLASADCHLVIQRRGAADAVLPSKLTNILAVGGNAVITADPDTSLGLLCSEYPGIAICVEPESISALIKGINYALDMPEKNNIATGYANEFLDKEKILSRFISEV
ncbi:WcaI family glycosyltransferase [Halomonas sp. WWR20]